MGIWEILIGPLQCEAPHWKLSVPCQKKGLVRGLGNQFGFTAETCVINWTYVIFPGAQESSEEEGGCVWFFSHHRRGLEYVTVLVYPTVYTIEHLHFSLIALLGVDKTVK